MAPGVKNSGWVTSRDEFELEFSSSSRAMKVPSRAELGHFNFRAETELTILTIVPIMCLIDASSRVATNHHDDLDLFTFLFSNRMLLDK